jgi:hypothetical protein
MDKFKETLQYFYYLYIIILPALGNFYLVDKLSSDNSIAIFLIVGLFVTPMYYAVRIETLKFPQKYYDLIFMVIAPFIPLGIIISNNKPISEYFGILIFNEVVSMLLGIIFIGLLGGSISNTDNIFKNIKEIAKDPLVIYRKFQELFLPLSLIVVLLIGLLSGFSRFIFSFNIFEVLFIFILPITINIFEYFRSLNDPFRNKFDYAFLVIIGIIIWIVTFGISAY